MIRTGVRITMPPVSVSFDLLEEVIEHLQDATMRQLQHDMICHQFALWVPNSLKTLRIWPTRTGHASGTPLANSTSVALKKLRGGRGNGGCVGHRRN